MEWVALYNAHLMVESIFKITTGAAIIIAPYAASVYYFDKGNIGLGVLYLVVGIVISLVALLVWRSSGQ